MYSKEIGATGLSIPQTLTINSQDITAVKDVAVTQISNGKVITGTLNTALEGATTKIIIDGLQEDLDRSSDVVVGGITIAAGDITDIYAEKDRETCRPCQADSASTETGKDTECDSCESEKTSTEGKTVCEACPKGWYMKEAATASGTKKCGICPLGYMSLYGAKECDICHIGTFGTNNLDTEDRDKCTNCEPGFYLGEDGKSDPSACIECPAGRYSSAKGATNIEECNKCSPGRASNKAGADGITEICDKCAITEFASIEAATQCETCPAGFTSYKVGSTLCEQCVGGSKIKCSLVLVSYSYSYCTGFH